jgi:hypothetical protein
MSQVWRLGQHWAAAIDGRFRSGPLMGKTVNVKWYLKQEGLLDMTESEALDFYLVMTGPHAAAVSSRSSTRPWRIDAVYLFDAADLLGRLRARNLKIGLATSILNSQWKAAEIFPVARNALLPVTATQESLLRLFATQKNRASAVGAPSPARRRARQGYMDNVESRNALLTGPVGHGPPTAIWIRHDPA